MISMVLMAHDEISLPIFLQNCLITPKIGYNISNFDKIMEMLNSNGNK